jgi:hypothetical protein
MLARDRESSGRDKVLEQQNHCEAGQAYGHDHHKDAQCREVVLLMVMVIYPPLH